jgi:hypothetical protein
MASEDNDLEIEEDEVDQAQHERRRQSKGPLPKKNGNWRTKDLEMALNNIDEGMSIQLAAKLARIPTSFVRDHYTGKTMEQK